uniref:Uncharacterized protein n=1 Tax=Magallana gigas TaxID=29159 RepID=A0A8W8JJG9_MAGGI
MHPCNCSLFRLLVVMSIVLHGIGKATVVLSNSCEVSRSTEQVVDGCPESEEEWREAAARKNCYAYSSQCSEPTRLVYHCVINPYVNQTLEVCAYAQNIVSGRCASYYFSGNLIKRNLRTKCSAFEEKPCPIFYRSDKAYNYPGCYELTKKSTTAAYITENTSAAVTTLTPKGSSNTYVDMYVNKLKLSSDKMCVIVNMVKVNVNRAHTNQIYVD